jgi:hypothetical protein
VLMRSNDRLMPLCSTSNPNRPDCRAAGQAMHRGCGDEVTRSGRGRAGRSHHALQDPAREGPREQGSVLPCCGIGQLSVGRHQPCLSRPRYSSETYVGNAGPRATADPLRIGGQHCPLLRGGDRADRLSPGEAEAGDADGGRVHGQLGWHRFAHNFPFTQIFERFSDDAAGGQQRKLPKPQWLG